MMKIQVKPRGSRLIEAREKDLWDELNEILLKDQLFLSKELSTDVIATKLKVPGYRIPKLVKKYLGVSVPEFINKLRIEYLHYKIKSDAKWRRMTIDEMASSSGFGSRNAFYTAYRKLFKTSPTAFIDEILAH